MIRAALSLLALMVLTLGAGWAAAPARKPVAARPAAKPVTVPLSGRVASTDLARIFVGNQAGVLKIYGRDRKTVLFVKDAPGVDMVGIDGIMWARLEERHRTAIFTALEIRDDELGGLAAAIMRHFPKLQQTQAVALLGVIGSVRDGRLAPGTAVEIRRFLEKQMAGNKNVVVRRQAVLSLGLLASIDLQTVESMLAFMARSRNAWETFTTKQFFEYHREFVRGIPGVRDRVHATGNPYSADIAAAL